jgi:hypothetical protein
MKVADTVAPTDNPWLKAFVWSMGGAILIDLALVFLGFTSISMEAWIQTNLHPTLIAAGILGGCWVALKIRTDWKALFFWGIMIGHLFVHW